MNMMGAVMSRRCRPTLPSIAIIGLALLTAGACTVEPPDAPVRSVTPAGSWTLRTELQPPATLELRPAQRTETMLPVPDLRLSSGGMYTMVVIGRTRIEPPLETLVLEDRIARQNE
jgi:hypothetical protein